MRERNQSYFDPELCLDGHYIVTGYTNDQFCGDLLQLSDVKLELHRYLRYSQGFDAVCFLDSVNMLFCYDQQSYDILLGNGPRREEQPASPPEGEIIAGTPLGRRRRRREASPASPGASAAAEPAAHAAPAAPGSAAQHDGPLHMGRQAIRQSWEQVTALLRTSPYRCALVLSNADSLISSMGVQEMAVLEELQSYHSENHSIVIYLFRDTKLSSLFESVRQSAGGAAAAWARVVQNVLLSRIETRDPSTNRVISLRTPNSLEVRNLLTMLRLRQDAPLQIAPGDVSTVAEELAASCARMRWGLGNLLERLTRFAARNPELALSGETWRQFTGETDYEPPMRRLDSLIGLDDVKESIRDWFSLQELRLRDVRRGPAQASRFAPLPTPPRQGGHALNLALLGGPGTGKTTVARLIGQLYYQLGLLPQGQLIECTRADLVSPYQGETARLVRDHVQEAMGGVLFIDEAYSLATPDGLEAINQLVSDMSTYEGQFAVVLAGYPDEMERFMRQNEGLAGRFGRQYTLPDYTPGQMKEIFLRMAGADPDGVTIDPALAVRLDDFCEAWVGGRTRGWRNAGEAQTLLTEMKRRCSSRLARDRTGETALALRPEDVPERLLHCLKPRSRNLEEAFAGIDSLIGLSNVKKFLHSLSRNIIWGEEDGAPGNYIFFGPPGTGKTMVARRIGELLGLLGLLRRKVNNVVECRAADLLNGTVRLREAVQNARGGVFFLDEAHQLEQNERGHAIIRELVPLIEDPAIRSDTCFICAGYNAEMRRFLAVDRGLSRRFPPNHRIRFDDYTAAELTRILALMARERGQLPSQEYLDRSRAAFSRFLENRPKNFGNGGFIRDVYLPGSLTARAERLNRRAVGEDGRFATAEQVASLPEEERRTLTAADVPPAFAAYAGPIGAAAPKERTAWMLVDELFGKEEFAASLRARAAADSGESFPEEGAPVGLHYAVSGATGTGRHTVVRAAAAVFRTLGLLDSDEVFFVGKADLEAGYVGQTALRTRDAVENAIGGTLAVEYPSAMLPKNANDNSYGPEALGVIAGAMSEHFHDLCVVFLDTAEGLDELFRAFPSLRSGLSRRFDFEELSPEDMQRLFELKTSAGMTFPDELRALLPDFFLNWVSDRGGLGESVRAWGNGAEIDRLAEELRAAWSQRHGETRTETARDGESTMELRRRLVTQEMFPAALRRYLTPSRAVADSAMQELERMTGLRRVKASIRALERRIRYAPRDRVFPGTYCYLGNPGVGKTTVARLMGGVLRAAGVLSQGHVIVRTARQLGDNPGELDSVLRLARNGVLFIDEAHQLAEPQNVWGRSVIKRLVTVLEDPEIKRNTCIILAGYPWEMERLLAVDSGLQSRFGGEDSRIVFEDYTAEELLSILDDMASRADRIPEIGSGVPLRPEEAYRQGALRVFRRVTAEHSPDFGNARFVRTLLHDSLDALYARLDAAYGPQGNPPAEALGTLTEQDLPSRYEGAREERQPVRLSRACVRTDPPAAQGRDALDSALSGAVVLLEVYRGGRRVGEGTGSIVTPQGHVLTCAHIAENGGEIRARLSCPGAIGGDTRWFPCTLLDPVCSDCDMALLKLEGDNFPSVPIRPREEPIRDREATLLLGYPLGAMLSGNRVEDLRITAFEGRIASSQPVRGLERYYIDSTGLHGNSGSPVFSQEDGRMIGVFCGSILPGGERNLDELNYFHPISCFWDRFTIPEAER